MGCACVSTWQAHVHASGFVASGLPGVSGGWYSPSPAPGDLRRPDRSAVVLLGKAVHVPSRRIVDTLPFHPIPPSAEGGFWPLTPAIAQSDSKLRAHGPNTELRAMKTAVAGAV